MAWHTYCLAPIDFNWDYCKSVEETAEEIRTKTTHQLDIACHQCPTLEEFEEAWLMAKRLAHENHWDGDFNRGPVVFWIPTHNSFNYGFAFKQEDDGVTFVVSPEQLLWLEE